MASGNDRRSGNERRQGGRPGGRREEDTYPHLYNLWRRDKRRAAAYDLAEARDAQAWIARRVTACVVEARAQGIPWAEIGAMFGLTREGARKRWGAS